MVKGQINSLLSVSKTLLLSMKHKILSVKCFLGQRRLSEFIYRWSEFFPINEKQCFSSNQNIDKYTCPSYIYKKTQVMKTILTLIFVLFIGVAAQAKTLLLK